MADNTGARLGATLVALFVVALLLWFVGSVAQIVILVFVSVLLGAYLGAFTDIVVRAVRIPRLPALVLALLLSTLGVIGIIAVVMPPVVDQGQDLIASLPQYEESLQAAIDRLAERYPVIERFEGGSIMERMRTDVSDFVRASMLPYITAGGTVMVELVSVLAMALYFARDPTSYREGFISLVPPRVRHIARNTLVDLSNTIKAWISGQMLAMALLAILTAVGLWLLNVPYALAFGVFAGAVAVVPFFGTIVSTLLPALFVLATGAVGQSLAVALLGVGVHLVEANLVAPLIFQERIKLPPVATIVSVLIAAKVLGILGLIVAVPLLATTVVIVRHVLIGQVYGDVPPGAMKSAVLVPTQEHRFLTIP